MRKPWRLALISATLLTALLPLSCGGRGYSSPTEPSNSSGPKTVVVAVKDDAFDPRDITVNPGDTVRWELQGSLLNHTVTDTNGAFDSGAVFTAPGAAFEQKLTQANVTYNYFCKVHGACCNMKGSIRVGDSAPSSAPGY